MSHVVVKADGKVLMKELDPSVETSEMENTSGRSIKTERPLLPLM